MENHSGQLNAEDKQKLFDIAKLPEKEYSRRKIERWMGHSRRVRKFDQRLFTGTELTDRTVHFGIWINEEGSRERFEEIPRFHVKVRPELGNDISGGGIERRMKGLYEYDQLSALKIAGFDSIPEIYDMHYNLKWNGIGASALYMDHIAGRSLEEMLYIMNIIRDHLDQFTQGKRNEFTEDARTLVRSVGLESKLGDILDLKGTWSPGNKIDDRVRLALKMIISEKKRLLAPVYEALENMHDAGKRVLLEYIGDRATNVDRFSRGGLLEKHIGYLESWLTWAKRQRDELPDDNWYSLSEGEIKRFRDVFGVVLDYEADQKNQSDYVQGPCIPAHVMIGNDEKVYFLDWDEAERARKELDWLRLFSNPFVDSMDVESLFSETYPCEYEPTAYDRVRAYTHTIGVALANELRFRENYNALVEKRGTYNNKLVYIPWHVQRLNQVFENSEKRMNLGPLRDFLDDYGLLSNNERSKTADIHA